MNIDKLIFLPQRLKNAIKAMYNDSEIIEEIRIRKNRNAYIIISAKNYILDVVINEREMLEMIQSVTRKSLYAYRDQIIKGYIPYDSGIRIGIIGTATTENDRLVGIHAINELAIRLPNSIQVNVSDIIENVRDNSVLIYSPPGVGKTTLLRCLIKNLSSGRQAKRVAVIDTRDELTFELNDKQSLASVLCGYPIKHGIEVAVRTMNPEMIVCDEIGDENSAAALVDIQGAGVPIIATCHGSSVKDIFSHQAIAEMHRYHIFDYYIGISRGNNHDFSYSVKRWEDANGHL